MKEGDIIRCGGANEDARFWMWSEGACLSVKPGHTCPIEGCKDYVLSISEKKVPGWVQQASYNTQRGRARRSNAN